MVNNGWGESFEMLGHSKWNGMTPCDLVFPFFLFIMGISCYLSLVKSEFKPTPQVIRRIVKRTVLLFAIGLFINWFDHAIEGDLLCFGHLRIWAVMQRIALCYGIVSLFALFCNHKYTVPVIIGLLVIYTAILVMGNGYAEDASVNVLAQVDLNLFGYDHIYHKSPVDPEGLMGTISSVAHVLLGFYCGMMIKKRETVEQKVIALFVVGTIGVIGGYLLSGIAAAGAADVRDRHTEEERLDHILPRVRSECAGTLRVERIAGYFVRKYRCVGGGV